MCQWSAIPDLCIEIVSLLSEYELLNQYEFSLPAISLIDKHIS
jgi:hypothetical protein